MSIEYRPWPRHPRFLAGEDGSVIGPSGRILQPYRRKRDGRPVTSVRAEGYCQIVPIHLIVAEAWHGLRPADKECAHGNGDCTDNRPANLRWATHVENEADKHAHGTRLHGEHAPWARLTEDAVRAIRAEYATGLVVQYELAERYGLTQQAISRIITRRTWRHVVE